MSATHRRMVWTVAALGIAVVLVAGVLEVSGGSVSTSVAQTRSAPLRATTEVDGRDYCSFLAPCSASPGAVHVDDVPRATIESPSSPNPNACWYCLIHGVQISYGQWYMGLDYAHPVATLKIPDASTPPPVLHLTGTQVRAALLGDGYDLDPLVTVRSEVCLPGVACTANEVPMDPDGLSTSMSGPAQPGDTWEVVPVVAERAYASTDNSWNHLGETRTSGEQKVLMYLAEVVLH